MNIFKTIIFILALYANAAHSSEAGRGYLDSAIYSRSNHALTVYGWVASEKQNIFVTNIMVDVDGAQIYQGRLQRSERDDVAAITGRQDWLASGFEVGIQLPDSIEGGVHSVHARARFSNGDEIALPAASSANTITLPAKSGPSIFIKLAIFMALITPIAAVLGAARLQASVAQWRRCNPATFGQRLFGLALLISFCTLVVTGSSGSSLALLIDNSHIAAYDANPWLGKAQNIRSDEWEVITPMAISQTKHEPVFPIVSRNWGSQGHNMLVVGMTGVPVAHISAVAKPATWGFFLFDLRQALAWYWWFPFFGCLTALWLVFLRFFDLNWKISAGLATSFAFAPYAVVFSGWPAYAAFFPLASLLFAQNIFQQQKLLPIVINGTLLGVSTGGFALVLYPAWQISLAYVLVPFGLAWCWCHRQQLHFGIRQWSGIFTALCVFLLTLGLWWIDAREAVHVIQNTVYPGQRVFEAGGDIDPWFFIKGLLSLQTMYRPTPLMDPSDAGSFIFIPLALAVACVLAFKTHKKTRLIGMVLAIYMLAVAVYMFSGFNPTIARVSFWGAVTSYRLDLALGLTQILLMGWIFSNATFTGQATARLRWAAWSAGVATLVWGAFLYRLLPTTIANDLLEPVRWLALIAWGALAYLVIARHYTHATVFFCTWMLAISLPFNPLGQAPTRITVDNALAQGIERAISGDAAGGEIAILDERTWSLLLPIVGKHVTNSVFYHPPTEFWRNIDPTEKSASIYNRYQRLFLRLQSLPEPQYYTIQSPRLDEVVLSMDPQYFNFKNLGAQALLSPGKHKDILSKNTSLEYIEGTDQWSIFRIKN